MTGYVGKPALDASKWFPTGDLGFLLEGRLAVVGRRDEVIVVRGNNVLLTEIESLVSETPGVRQGAVGALGTPDNEFVVYFESSDPNDDSALSATQAIRRNLTYNLGLAPRAITVVGKGTIPRTPSGKLQRTELQRLFFDNSLGGGELSSL